MFATVTGALPRRGADGPDLDALERGVRDGTADRAALEAAIEDRVARLVAEQAAAALEPITDGQVRAADLHAAVAARMTTGEDLGLVAAWRATAGQTTLAVKQALPGPYTLGRRLATRPRDRERATLEAAASLGSELRRLADAGCPLVEVEEPAAVAIGGDPAERALFVEAHRRLLEPAAGVHVSLAIAGGDATAAGEATLLALPYASYLFDLIAGPDHWRVIARTPGDRGIVCGALDARAEAADDPALLVWALHYAASTGGRGTDRVGLANAGSLRDLAPERLAQKLRVLGEAARIAAAASVDDIAALLDPRAIDSRTAALGGVRPRPRARTRRSRRG